MKRIHYTKPSITDLEISYATDAATNGWGEHCYEYIERFEEAFRQFTGAKYAIATSSCTGALHMGLSALGISADDEVILADTNWIATAAPITYLGAKPVFVDILQDTWCIDPQRVEEAITPRTKAIIAVHLYGNLCEMDSLKSIGEKYDIPILEDAAEAIGSFYHGAHAGTIGEFGCFSFHGTKTITTGEGGMFITNNPDLYESVQTLSNHGRSNKQIKQFHPDTIGFKYKMSNIQAAIGCAQIKRIDILIKKKREIFLYYKNAFKKIQGINLNPEKKGTINSYWMPTAIFDKETGISREKLIKAFSSRNIDARVFFWPLSSLNIFDNVNTNNIYAYDFPERAINLPSYFEMTTCELDRVICVIKDLIAET